MQRLGNPDGDWYYLPSTGYQGLWEKVAKKFEVKLGSKVEILERGMNIVVKDGQGQREFDYLLWACPYDQAQNLMMLSQVENNLFDSFLYYNYVSSIIEIDELPDLFSLNGQQEFPVCNMNFFSKHSFSKDQVGNLLCLVKPHLTQNIYIAYQYKNQYINDDELKQWLCKDVEALGGKVKKVWAQCPWNYFPRVTSEQIREGFFDKLEELQGERNTFYLGEALCAPAVEEVIRYSFDLVDTNF